MENKGQQTEKAIIRKISVLELVKILNMMYSMGADYVDIVGVIFNDDTNQDEILVATKEEYMQPLEGGEEYREPPYYIEDEYEEDEYNDNEGSLLNNNRGGGGGCGFHGTNENNNNVPVEKLTEEQINKLIDGHGY